MYRNSGAVIWGSLTALLVGGVGFLIIGNIGFLAQSEESQRDQVSWGEEVFAESCARCHGAEGEGGRRFPDPIIGPRHRLARFGDAAGLFQHNYTLMPYDNPRSLPEDEVWAVTAFILDANDLLPPEIELGPETAEEIELRRD